MSATTEPILDAAEPVLETVTETTEPVLDTAEPVLDTVTDNRPCGAGGRAVLDTVTATTDPVWRRPSRCSTP